MIHIEYNPAQSAATASRSPSPGKPALVVADWGLKTTSFKALSIKEISLAHDPKYVHDIMNLKAPNGHGTLCPLLRDTLPWTTGSMVAAAREAVRNGIGACSPTSGFHHAGYSHGGGFCTFNGLMIAAVMLHKQRIGIVDFDAHQGDGTDDIIRRLHLQSRVSHMGHIFSEIGSHNWLNILGDRLWDRFSQNHDLILYQAGADMWVDDPLGAGALTIEQLRRRDQIVFTAFRKMKIPVAWNLAGGYSDRIIEIHRNTLHEAEKAWQ